MVTPTIMYFSRDGKYIALGEKKKIIFFCLCVLIGFIQKKLKTFLFSSLWIYYESVEKKKSEGEGRDKEKRNFKSF